MKMGRNPGDICDMFSTGPEVPKCFVLYSTVKENVIQIAALNPTYNCKKKLGNINPA
jgi:hypothetical protein